MPARWIEGKGSLPLEMPDETAADSTALKGLHAYAWGPTGRAQVPWEPLRVAGSDDWTLLCSRSYVPLSTVAEPDFRGEMFAADFGEASVSQIGSTPSLIARDRRRIRSDPRETLILSMFLRSGGSVVQRGHSTHIGGGSGYLLDTDMPYSVRFQTPYDMLAVRLPISTIGIGRREISSTSGLSIPGDSQELSVLRNHLALLLAEAGPGQARSSATDEAAEQLIAELIAVLVQHLDNPEEGRRRLSNEAIVPYARHFMVRHFGDPAFGVDDIAREHAVTRRHLEGLFSRLGTSPGAHLRDLRLRRASQLLVAHSDASVGEVAARAGFGDVNTLIRSFRRRWGTTPHRWRRDRIRALEALPAAASPADSALLTALDRFSWAAIQPE